MAEASEGGGALRDVRWEAGEANGAGDGADGGSVLKLRGEDPDCGEGAVPAGYGLVRAAEGVVIGIGGAFALLFVGLKLTGYVGWAWGWVLAPIWVPLVVSGLCLAVGHGLQALGGRR